MAPEDDITDAVILERGQHRNKPLFVHLSRVRSIPDACIRSRAKILPLDHLSVPYSALPPSVHDVAMRMLTVVGCGVALTAVALCSVQAQAPADQRPGWLTILERFERGEFESDALSAVARRYRSFLQGLATAWKEPG